MLSSLIPSLSFIVVRSHRILWVLINAVIEAKKVNAKKIINIMLIKLSHLKVFNYILPYFGLTPSELGERMNEIAKQGY